MDAKVAACIYDAMRGAGVAQCVARSIDRVAFGDAVEVEHERAFECQALIVDHDIAPRGAAIAVGDARQEAQRGQLAADRRIEHAGRMCGDLECATRFAMTRADYESVRRHDTYFVLIPDHVDEQIEEVVEIRAGYVVVSKNGVAADVARETDPRDE